MNILEHAGRGRSLAMMGLICVAVLLPVSTAQATGWQANIREGSDIVMNDLRWPVWDQGTYYCFWYSSFFPNKYTSFYGGVAVHGPDRIPGMFTSYWGVTETIHTGEEFHGKGVGAEGSKGGASGNPSFQRPNAWYRMVMRVFPPTRDADKKTNVGWWIKDVERNKWYTHSILRLPVAETEFAANSGFVEALAPESVHRAFERRLGYCRLNGRWYSSDLSTKEPSHFKLIENDTVVRFDRSVKDAAGDKTFTFFPTEQADIPPLDKPAIEQAEAYAWGNQVSVRWKVPQTRHHNWATSLRRLRTVGPKASRLWSMRTPRPTSSPSVWILRERPRAYACRFRCNSEPFFRREREPAGTHGAALSY